MNVGFELPEELQLLQHTIRDFLRREVEPAERRAMMEDARGLPRDVVATLQPKAKEPGLWCFETPVEYGGAGLSPFAMAVAIEEASKHTYSIPDHGDGVFGYDPPNILLAGTPAQKEKYIRPSVERGSQWFMGITEPGGGSDPARAIRTMAVRDGDSWVLNGRKVFTSRVDVAERGIVFAQTGAGGRTSITAFIVDLPTEGFSFRRLNVIRDHHSNEVALENVRIPLDNILGDVGQGFQLSQRWLARGRIKIAAQSIGVGQQALDLARAYAQQRHTFGKVLAARQAVQWMLVDSYIELKAARWLLWEAAWKDERGEDSRHEASIAKLAATEAGYRAVDNAIQIFGGYGVSREMPLEHWLRALRVNRIVEGPSEVHRMLIARDLLGEAALDRPASR